MKGFEGHKNNISKYEKNDKEIHISIRSLLKIEESIKRKNRIQNISFHNTTELNSSIFFCRAHHNEFNYSSNPTYLSGSRIIVKNNEIDEAITKIEKVCKEMS